MNALLLTLAVIGQSSHFRGVTEQDKWSDYVAKGWAESRTAPDCDVYLTPKGCDLHKAPAWWDRQTLPVQWTPEMVAAWWADPTMPPGGLGCAPIPIDNLPPRRMVTGILRSYYVTHGPTWKNYIRVRYAMPSGATGVFIWAPSGPVRVSRLYPAPAN